MIVKADLVLEAQKCANLFKQLPVDCEDTRYDLAIETAAFLAEERTASELDKAIDSGFDRINNLKEEITQEQWEELDLALSGFSSTVYKYDRERE